MSANGSYVVTSNGADEISFLLPRSESLQVGSRVRVEGQGSTPWRIAQNALQTVDTRGLPGNVVPGANWVQRPSPIANWYATAQNAGGDRIVAVANGGGIHLSANAGASWSATSAPSAAWVSIAMTPDGSRIVAAAANDFLYTSTDGGATWLARGAARAWTGVTMSADGSRITAVAGGAGIYRSVDGGATFTAVRSTPDIAWRGIAGSADGMRLVAVASKYGSTAGNAGAYLSADGGATWRRQATWPTAGDEQEDWSYAASSADGLHVAVLDNGGYLYVSDDGGTSWRTSLGYSNWSGLAISADGRVSGALEPHTSGPTWNHRSWIFVSLNFGAPGESWDWTGLELTTNSWRGISLSADGQRVVVGDQNGRLYTSGGNRTSSGTSGWIGAGQGQAIELVYQGGGRFTVGSYAGGAFTIR